MENPYSNTAQTADVVIDPLRRQILPAVGKDASLVTMVDGCICDTVEQLWSAKVKVFVPVFADRRVRICLEQGSCDEVI